MNTVIGINRDIVTVSTGDIYEHSDKYYIISQCSSTKYALICLHDGNRWREPESFEDLIEAMDEVGLNYVSYEVSIKPKKAR